MNRRVEVQGDADTYGAVLAGMVEFAERIALESTARRRCAPVQAAAWLRGRSTGALVGPSVMSQK